MGSRQDGSVVQDGTSTDLCVLTPVRGVEKRSNAWVTANASIMTTHYPLWICRNGWKNMNYETKYCFVNFGVTNNCYESDIRYGWS